MFVGNAHTAEGDEVALAEAMHVVAMANSHEKRPGWNQGVIHPRIGTGFRYRGSTVENPGMMAQVILDETGDEVVAVVVTWLQTQLQRVAGLVRRIA